MRYFVERETGLRLSVAVSHKEFKDKVVDMHAQTYQSVLCTIVSSISIFHKRCISKRLINRLYSTRILVGSINEVLCCFHIDELDLSFCVGKLLNFIYKFMQISTMMPVNIILKCTYKINRIIDCELIELNNLN